MGLFPNYEIIFQYQCQQVLLQLKTSLGLILLLLLVLDIFVPCYFHFYLSSFLEYFDHLMYSCNGCCNESDILIELQCSNTTYYCTGLYYTHYSLLDKSFCWYKRMDATINEEALREAAANGNVDEISKLIESGVDIDSTNKMNGWSPLHWACKRGHLKAVEILLSSGAEKIIVNAKGETPADVTKNPEVLELLGVVGVPLNDSEPTSDLKFKPNYLSHPEFMYSKANHRDTTKIPENPLTQSFHYQPQTVTCTTPTQWAPAGLVVHPQFIVLCVRLAHVSKMNNDFVEVELDRQYAPTLAQLTDILCKALDMGVDADQIRAIRKLPHYTLKTDRDVQRLTDYQALELILQPDSLNPFDGSIVSLSSEANASPDSRYLKDHVSKLVY